MGIDMSSALDTIRRTSILELLIKCGCSDDEVRLVRLLLSNTYLELTSTAPCLLRFRVFLVPFKATVCLGVCLPLCLLAPCLTLETKSS